MKKCERLSSCNSVHIVIVRHILRRPTHLVITKWRLMSTWKQWAACHHSCIGLNCNLLSFSIDDHADDMFGFLVFE